MQHSSQLIHSWPLFQLVSLERPFTVDDILSNILAPQITITPRQQKHSGRHKYRKTDVSNTVKTVSWALLNKLLVFNRQQALQGSL